MRALLEKVAALPQGGDLYPVAMAALAADRAGVASEPAAKATLATLTRRAREALAEPAELRIDPSSYYSYPLRRAGLTAILGHAASLGDVDVAVTRRRLFEALSDRSSLSTFERSTALLHSLWLVERDAREMREGETPRVKGEGATVPPLVLHGAARFARLPQSLRAVTVADFDGQTELRAHIHVPLADVKPVADGMSIERRYYRLSPNGDKKLLGQGETIAQGDEVYVELTVDAHDGEPWRSIRSAYYLVEDQVPAGFTPLGEDKIYRGAPYSLPLSPEALRRRSLSPERALFYLEEPTFWSRSPRTVGYVIEGLLPGQILCAPINHRRHVRPQGPRPQHLHRAGRDRVGPGEVMPLCRPALLAGRKRPPKGFRTP